MIRTGQVLLATLLCGAGDVVVAQPAPLPAVCYSPFHLVEYPLDGTSSPAGIPSGIDTDFAQMAQLGYTTVRTYYSNYYGYDVAPIAAKHGLQLYLGVYMTPELWYQGQIDSAVRAVQTYPNTVKSVLVGNENVIPNGPYSASAITSQVNAIRNRIQNETGRVVPVGTVQRTAEWLQNDPGMLALGNASDVIGVNIYPFFDPNFVASQPQAILNGVWNAMKQKYGGDGKLLLTETGWPTGGTPTSFAPNNIPSYSNSQLYLQAFQAWMQSLGRQGDVWYSMYDSRPDEVLWADVEYHFGILTHDRKAKPTATTAAPPTPAPTFAPTAQPTPAPTLALTPTPTAAPTPAPTTAPTPEPTSAPTSGPTPKPTPAPTSAPTPKPTKATPKPRTPRP